MNIETITQPTQKRKFPFAAARVVAQELTGVLWPACEQGYCCVAGSLRRLRPEVGDIEILFVPRCGMGPASGEMFDSPTNFAERTIEDLCRLKQLRPRLNAKGHRTWGALIKLAEHADSGIPVDFFTATKGNWWNYLVCRTGPAESNLRIAQAARARGWKWEPYSAGFVSESDPTERVVMSSEREVFEFVNLPYREPEKR